MHKRFRFLIAAAAAGALALALPAQSLADHRATTECDNGNQPVVFAHTDNQLIFANVRVLCIQEDDPLVDVRVLDD